MLRYAPLLITLLALAAACGDEGEDIPASGSPSPTGTPSEVPQWTGRYMQLGDARQLLQDLGLEGTSLAPNRYDCIQMECPDEAPGDDSWGCLRLLPTGDPDNETAESLLPDDPPGWYAVGWGGTFGETYGAPPEPVIYEPKLELEPLQEMLCGADFERYLTAAEAVALLADLGLEGRWEMQETGMPAPTCAPSANCPVPGIASDTEGCLRISISRQSVFDAGNPDATVDVYVGWSSGVITENSDGLYFRYSLGRLLGEAEALVEPRSDDRCETMMGGRLNDPIEVYHSIMYTEVIEPTYWKLQEAPDATTLKLAVAIGGSCESFGRLDVEEMDTSVIINAFRRHSTGGPNTLCTQPLFWHFATIDLKAPLGARPLLGCAPAEIWHIDHDVDCAEPRSD